MKTKTCKHGVFNELWGEYKCKKKEQAIQSDDECNDCEYYESKKRRSEHE